MKRAIFLSRMTSRSLAVKALWLSPDKSIDDKPLALFSHHHYDGITSIPVNEVSKYLYDHTIVLDDMHSINDPRLWTILIRATSLIVLVTWYDGDVFPSLVANFPSMPIQRINIMTDTIPIAYSNVLSDQANVVNGPATVNNVKYWAPYLANLLSKVSHYQTKGYRQIILTNELELVRVLCSNLSIKTVSDENLYSEGSKYDALLVSELNFPVSSIDILHVVTNSIVKVDQCLSNVYSLENYIEGNRSSSLTVNFYPTKGEANRLSADEYKKRDEWYNRYLKSAASVSLNIV